ncbi:retrovirus-related Pol polyprotein from transposon 412 [Trichonephila clavipes]|nr:retrovirus-related Pol polyprotein from transposon 412 [Trichonephila clavipes]
MDELNNKLTANKEELKSDLKGIGDKLTTMDKKFEEMEGRIESVENKFEDMESKLEAKIFEKVEEVSISFRSDLEKLKQKVMTGQGDEFKFQAPYSKPSIKLFLHMTESPLGSRLQLKSRQQKVSETLQELATDVERLSHLAFSDCPTEVREVLALQHFIDGVRDPEIQKALRMADLKDLKGALVFAMKFEAAQQATRKDRHPIRAVNESDTKQTGRRPLNAGPAVEKGICREAAGHAKALKLNSASRKEVSEKLINGHLVGRRLPDFGKPHFQVCQISTQSTGENGLFIMGHVNELPAT